MKLLRKLGVVISCTFLLASVILFPTGENTLAKAIDSAHTKIMINPNGDASSMVGAAGLSNGKSGVLTKESGTYIYRIYDHSGILLSTTDISVIMGSRASNVMTLKVMGLANGKSLITWEGTNNGCDNKTGNMFQFTIIDSTGAVLKTGTDISTEASYYNCYTDMTELSDGKIAFIWQHAGDEYLTRIFNPDGTSFTLPSSIEKTGTREGNPMQNSSYTHSLAANKEGTYLVVYNFYNNSNYYAVLYNNDGTQKEVRGFNQFIVGSSSNSGNMSASVYALSNDNFLIVYKTSSTGYGLKIIDSNGNTISDITNATQFNYGDNYPNFLSLNNGGFLAMDSLSDDYYDEEWNYYLNSFEQKIREFDNDGLLVADWQEPDNEPYIDYATYPSTYTAGFLLYKGYDQGFMVYNTFTGKLILHNVYPGQSIPVIGGTVGIIGDLKYGSILTVDLSGITYIPNTTADNPSIQWQREGVDILGATDPTYTLTLNDIGKHISVVVKADGTNATGNVTSDNTNEVEKEDGPSAPSAPTLANKSTRSITLSTVDGQEYSKDNGVTWQDSPVFSALTPSTNYSFVTRVKETATQKASAESINTTLMTDSLPVIGGTVGINGDSKYGSILTVDLSGITYTPNTVDDSPTIQWQREGIDILGATNPSYTITLNDIGKQITVVVKADGINATGKVTSGNTNEVEKENGPSAPSAPTLATKSTRSITLSTLNGQEYSKDNGVTWQDSPVFSDLTPNTSYNFATRIKETETQKASAQSLKITIMTDSLPVIGGTTGINGDSKYGSTLTVDLSGITYTPNTLDDSPTFQWQRGGIDILGATNPTYTLTLNDIGKHISVVVKADGTNATGNVTSDNTNEVEKEDGPSAPSAPTLANKSTRSITLSTVDGQEYSKDNGVTWQDSPVFSALTPSTNYSFVTRVKETATQKASAESINTTLMTDSLPVIGGTVGINGDSKYGSILTVDLSGITYTPNTVDDSPTIQWQREGVDILGATSPTYTLTLNDIGKQITVVVEADGTNATGKVTSGNTNEVEKKDGPGEPSAPTLATKSTSSITLSTVEGQEYSKDNGLTWQDSPKFSELTPSTDYNFVTRVKETVTQKASDYSPVTTIRTSSISTSFPSTEQIVVDVVDGKDGSNLTKTIITRTKESDGTVKDKVVLPISIAKETVQKAKVQGIDTVRILIPDKEDIVAEVGVEVPVEALDLLYSGKLKLEISTPNGIISIPTASLYNYNKDLYFRIVPIKTEDKKKQIEERAKYEQIIQEAIGHGKIQIIGRPMEIETNMQGREVLITLPLTASLPSDSAKREEFLNNLGVFIEHSDGSKELIKGSVLKIDDDSEGLQFKVNKFSTFTMVYLEGWEVDDELTTIHSPYVKGYGKEFRPESTVTRGQIATMLAQNLQEEPSIKSFNDIPSTHWAYEAIMEVRGAGIMSGKNEVTFDSNGKVTRAQMATIAYNWIQNACQKNPKAYDSCAKLTNIQQANFKDVPVNHWAGKAINFMKASGTMVGSIDKNIFRPNEQLTRAQAVVVLNNLFKRGPLTNVKTPSFVDVPQSHWAFGDIEEAAKEHSATLDSK